MSNRENRELDRKIAHGFGAATMGGAAGGHVRLDWMLALGRTSLEQGDLRTALKYFTMVLGMDDGNAVANYYRDITTRLIERDKGGELYANLDDALP